MSKSYGNTIEIFGDEKALRKKVMGIKMDSRTPQEPKPDADQNIAVQILNSSRRPGSKGYEDRLRAGGLGYGDLKKALFENYWNHFAEARARRAELAANLDYVQKILAEGAEKARSVAQKVLKRAKVASGLSRASRKGAAKRYFKARLRPGRCCLCSTPHSSHAPIVKQSACKEYNSVQWPSSAPLRLCLFCVSAGANACARA